jgi:hypothetical protein
LGSFGTQWPVEFGLFRNWRDFQELGVGFVVAALGGAGVAL